MFFADAESMQFIRKVEIREDSGTKSVVGSIFPSPDGEKVFLITNRTFQIVDVATGKVDGLQDLGRIHDPFNHMISISDTDWSLVQ